MWIVTVLALIFELVIHPMAYILGDAFYALHQIIDIILLLLILCDTYNMRGERLHKNKEEKSKAGHLLKMHEIFKLSLTIGLWILYHYYVTLNASLQLFILLAVTMIIAMSMRLILAKKDFAARLPSHESDSGH